MLASNLKMLNKKRQRERDIEDNGAESFES
jgi:hypothetical protein